MYVDPVVLLVCADGVAILGLHQVLRTVVGLKADLQVCAPCPFGAAWGVFYGPSPLAPLPHAGEGDGKLFDGDGLRQIPRLIHIRPLEYRDMVAKQL